MSPVAELAGKDLYLSHFAERRERLPGRDLDWLRDLRQQAITRFAELGFPTTRLEDWKYTNVAPLTRVPFRPADGNGRGGGGAGPLAAALGQVPFANAGFVQLVFVDGRFSPERSRLGTLPDGAEVRSLREALASAPGAVEEHLGRHADHREHAFTALNTAFFHDGAFVRLPASMVIEEPLHLVFLATGHGEPTVIHPRNLIVAGPQSAATIIEHYVGVGVDGGGGPAYFTNAVTEIVAGPGAAIAHHRLQEENKLAFHMGTVQVHQDRDSRFTSHSLSHGARLARIEVRDLIAGEGADCTLSGLYLGSGRQHVDHHTLIDHARPHGTSHELFKGILGGAARGVFTGRIIVREDAQKTSAHQTNRNLLLSDEALADTRPQLEIRNNDVACTHGATIGRLDPELVFYLRSRGIPLEEARSLLAHAFANEVLSSIRVAAVRAEMETVFAGWLSQRSDREPAGGEGGGGGE